MSLTKPDEVQGTFRGGFFCKAKAEPACRFYVLYDKICRGGHPRSTPIGWRTSMRVHGVSMG